MTDRVRIIKGFQDVLPPRSEQWGVLESRARAVFLRFGFQEIRLPVLEHTELFARGIGEGTDIVEKEMYTFADRKGRSLSLRPEGTASLVRAYLDSDLGKGEGAKWFYAGPMFRYERPQKGRYRQFYQIGAEALGFSGPGTDAELLHMLDLIFKEAGVHDRVKLELNSLGCKECRPRFRAELLSYMRSVSDRLCEDCKKRMERNPLRVLDCKVPSCREAIQSAPTPISFLCGECADHFKGVRSDLEIYGVEYRVNPLIVRGLDYYTRTVFEHLAEDGLGSQNAVCAGGRYDGLVEEFGGPPTPGIGFAIGVERLALLADEIAAAGPEFFVVASGAEARSSGLRLLAELRRRGYGAEMVVDAARSLKSQMKSAGKTGARKVLIIGEQELAEGTVTIKDLVNSAQDVIDRERFLAGL